MPRGGTSGCQSVDLPGPAGAPALLSEHCERLWLLPRAGVLEEVGVEVPVLCEPQGGAMLEQAGSLAGIVGHGIG